MLYPIGIQSFEKIRQGGYVYVDKTDLIYKIAKTGQYYFLSRPRRFGKSLLLSTMEAYFRGRKELFDGLAIASLEKDWTEYPVLHFDLGGASYTDMDSLNDKLGRQLNDLESEYGVVRKYKTLPVRFETIIEAAYRKTGRQVVILVDEYDKPVIDNLGRPELQDKMRETLRGFYGVMKSKDAFIRFGFLTGVTKIGKMSVFSDLNNPKDISMDSRYTDICGVSETDLTDCFAESVRELAEANGLSEEECRQKLALMYDGYHFCHGSEDIYNPFSLIKCLDAREFGSYWFETGTPTFLLERLRKNPMDETKLDKMTEIAQSDFDISPELTEDTLPMLYQTGYLTIKGYNKEDHSYTLGYPNREVREGFLRGLLANYKSSEGMSASFVLKFNKALKDNDVNGSLELLQTFMAGIPYDLENKTEKHYQTIIYLVFSLLGYYTQTEVKSAVGRADAVCRTKDGTYVFEFKVDGSAEEALKQIDEKGYMIPYKKEGRCVKVGVNISSVTRTLDSWKVAEEV